MSVKIYLAYFNDSYLIRSDVLTPIQVGRANSPLQLCMIGDDTGENISALNPSYCELTGHYWVWKNDKASTHVGFMHYRRVLDFAREQTRENATVHGVIEETISEEVLDEYGMTDPVILDTVERYALILPEPYNIGNEEAKSVEAQYASSKDHYKRDFQTAREVVRDLSPEYSRYFEKMARGRLMYPANMFISERAIFDEYAEWIFAILTELEKRIDTTSYNASARRVIGYLGERLFTVFVLRKLEQLPHKKVLELRRVFFKDTTPAPTAPDIPKADLPIVSVVASSDSEYLPHLSALIASVLDNADHGHFIDFVVLDGGITKIGRKLLRDLEALHPHVRISFVDMSKQFLNIPVHYYFARSTFYRLAMPEVLMNRSRVLFLDTDMIVVDDVCQLFNEDLEGKLVAASRDLVMASFRAMGVRSLAELGAKTAENYLADVVGMGKSTADYFQAGTILFDLDGFRRLGVHETMIHDLQLNRYWFLDQDVLNKHLVGRVKFIDNRWNVLFIDEKHRSCLSTAERDEYMKATSDPSIVHFAGTAKPWKNGDNPLGHYYWYYLRKTHWYETMLFRFVGQTRIDPATPMATPQTAIAPSRGTSRSRKALASVWHALPQTVRRAMMPIAIKIDHRTR